MMRNEVSTSFGRRHVEILPPEQPLVRRERRFDPIMSYEPKGADWRLVAIRWVIGGLVLGWVASQWIDLRGYLGELSLEEKKIDLEIARVENKTDGLETALGVAVLGMIIAGAAGGVFVIVKGKR